MSAPGGLVNGWIALAWSATWQLAALALLAWLGQRALKVRHPRPRHAVWWLVLAAPLLLAPGRVGLERRDTGLSVNLPAPIADLLPAPVIGSLGGIPSAAPSAGAVTTGAAPPSAPLRPGSAAWPPRVRAVDMLAMAWVLCCALLILRLLLAHARMRSVLAASRPLDDPRVLVIMHELGARAGLRRAVGLRTSAAVGAPVLYGLCRPVILVPEGWGSAFEGDALRSLLAHEIAHIRRGDCWANLAQRLIGVPLFFHPVAWFASRQITLAREELCDTWAVEHSAGAYSYARSLAAAAEHAHANVVSAPLGLAESRFTLLARVEAIMNGADMQRWSRPLAVTLTGMLLASAAAFAALRVTRSEPPRANLSAAKAIQRSPKAAPQHSAATPSRSVPTADSADTTSDALFERADGSKDEAAMGLVPWEQVEKAYLAVLQRNPEDGRAREDLGRMYTRWGRYTEAMGLLEPVSPGWAALNYAFCLDALGKRKDALALYGRLEGNGTMGVWAQAGLSKPIWPKDLDIRPQPGEARLKPTPAWRATASSSSSPSKPAFATDGNLYSRWTTEGAQTSQQPGEWFQIAFPAPQRVTRIVFDHQGRGTYYVSDWPRGFDAEVTADGKSWSRVAGTPGGPNQPVTVSFKEARRVQAIRLTLTGAHDPEWWSIYEVCVFGPGKQREARHVARGHRNSG